MSFKALIGAVIVAVAVSFSTASRAQSIVSEDFTGTQTNSQWFFFNGACLTAGTSTSTTSPGIVPGCATVISSYYHTRPDADAAMTGGEKGYLGSTTAPSSYTAVVPDDSGSGALRFTNGAPYGHNESGAIVSNYTFPTSQGVEISFKTVTYLGNSGGGAHDGADGISFYLLDGCMPVTGGTVPGTCTFNSIYGTGQTFPAIGAFGGSLAYSCSNNNSPYDGLVGGYLGLGVDEYGNFLNGTNNTLGETGSSNTGGDNTATGGLYQPGRIGLRGAGSISWQALKTAYGTLSSTGPYYPASLETTCSNGGIYNSGTGTCGVVCSSGVYNSAKNTCDICASGYTFSQSANKCGSCNAGATYDPTTNTCSPAATCSSGTYNAATNSCSTICTSGTYNATANKCGSCSSGTINWSAWLSNGAAYCDNVCPSGYTYKGTNTTYPNTCLKCSSGSLTSGTTKWSCSSGGTLSTKAEVAASLTSPTSVSPTPTLVNQNPTTVAPTTGATLYKSAVQKTCATGHLWNYSTPTAPTDAGPATLSTDPTNPNTANTAGIMDYPAISGAYSVIPTPTNDPVNGFLIANESATTRSAAAPIVYNLKITQDGLLSFSYSYNGGTAVPVISNQKITAANGPLPSAFRFGFAGSTGGSTNAHEILCFKAAPVQASSSSGAVNVYRNPTLHTGTETFIATYYPSDWTGQLQAIGITTDSSGKPVAASTKWDARCVLTGVDPATGLCDSTGLATPSAEDPTARVMLTWDSASSKAEAFEWASLTTAQKNVLTAGDATASDNRLKYLRGDRTNEITSSGTGFYRARNSILSDIVDSSPTWIGPPENPYTLVPSWVDQLYPTDTQPENASGAQKYADYMSPSSTKNTGGAQSRANIVYAGANDGFLHGFQAGALTTNGDLDTSTIANDGKEVLAYMPGAVLNNIHPVDSSGNVISQLDFSNTQYSHNWYVDASPGQGDVFYNKAWHTWVVSGLGPGGAAIFALDVTDPSQFSEANASKIVIGEWTPTTLTCPHQTVTTCGANLGNTFGTPQIRRFHNGQWGFIFGNGFGSANGASGIYIALLDGSTGAPTFYYFPTKLTPSATVANGIATPEPADLDLDHTVDFIYAGDLLGNLWRFDVTSKDPANWGVSASSPLFTAGQPITTQPQVSTIKTITTVTNAVGLDVSNAPQRVMINFGTGQQTPQTLNAGARYASGSQYLYGVWDWDMGTPSTPGTWNALSPHQQGIGLTAPQTITTDNMQSQTLTETLGTSTTQGTASLTHNVVCWKGGSACGDGSSGANAQMGWFTQLPSTGEQIIFDPFVSRADGSLVFNTFIPSSSSVLSCTQEATHGFSIGMDASTGAGLTLPLFSVGGASYDGVQLDATGTGSVINSGAAGGGKNYLMTHTSNGTIDFTQMNGYTVTSGQRVYWIQKR